MFRSSFRTVVAAALTALILASCASSPPSDGFENAIEACVPEAGSSDVRIEDGTQLRINNRGEQDNSGIPLDDVWCLLAELEVPEDIVDRMINTSGSDGDQTAEYGGYTVAWRYFPPTGSTS